MAPTSPTSPARPFHASAAHAAATALGATRNPARSRFGADGDDDGGFAAQLLRAQPAPPKEAKSAAPASSDGAAPAARDDKDSQAARDPQSPDGAPAAPDPALLQPWMPAPPQAPAPATPTTALAGQAGADAAELAGIGLGSGGAAAPLAALRKGAKGAKDEAWAGLGKDAQGLQADGALAGKGAQAADPTAALAKAAGADNAATGTRDSLAASLSTPDPVSVQAGAIGASPNALLDTRPAVEQAAASAPAQATLAMAPQSPAFAPALGQQIEVWMRDGIGHAEVQLTPQDLGPIRVKIAVEGTQTRVEMSADVPSTRDALQQALPQLSDSLSQVGLSLTGGGVSDQPGARSQAQDQAGTDGASGGPGGRSAGARTRGMAGDVEADVASVSAARQALQRRGLLDLYA